MITLKKLFIKNFKAFQEEQPIPLERITLLFGKNSVGKSTILHAVALLRQILQTGGKLDMDQLILANKQVNLGSLDDVRFEHDSNNNPTISVECVVNRPFGSLAPDHVLGSSSIFSNDKEEFTDIEHDEVDLSGEDGPDWTEPGFVDFTDEDGHHYSVDNHPIRSTFPRQTTSGPQSVPSNLPTESEPDDDFPLSLWHEEDQVSPLTKFQTGDLLRVSWELHEGFHIVYFYLNDVIIATYKESGRETPKRMPLDPDLSPLQTLSLAHPLVQRARELLYRYAIHHGNWDKKERLTEHKLRSINQFNTIFNDWFENDLKSTRHTPYEYLYSGQEKFRVNIDLESYHHSNLPDALTEACREAFNATLDPNRYSGIGYDEARKEMVKLFNAVATDHLGWMPSNLHYLILREIGKCFGTDYIPAHRPPPPREVTKTRISEWITQGASTMSWVQLFDEKVLDRFNAWLDYIGVEITGVCRKLEIHDPDSSSNPIAHDPQIVFAKRGRNLRSSHADLGYGVGQLVPILVAGSSTGLIGIKIVEQPEAQIHPGLQAQMGDFFIGQSSNWLIETHSEHMILRILRRIRETTEKDFNDWPDALKEACPNGVKPEDVSVLYVEPGEDGARIKELRINHYGEFIDEWPNGFFEERIREVF